MSSLKPPGEGRFPASTLEPLEIPSSPERQPAYYPLPLPVDWLSLEASRVLRRLHAAHFESYLVGGCVRDLLLGRCPKDFDIATAARPLEVRRLFANCRLIGRRFRLAHIIYQDTIIEVATFRKDPLYSDDSVEDEEESTEDLGESGEGSNEQSSVGAPEEVDAGQENPHAFSRLGNSELGVEREDILIRSDNVFGTPREDAVRRDFSVNSLFYDVATNTVVDWIGGMADICERVIRTIGPPEIRFREDPVRMLRAVKFAASLRFTIDAPTWEAVLKVAPDIRRAAPPRLLEEILRMLRGGASVRSIELMFKSGLLKWLLPEIIYCLQGDNGQGSTEGQENEALAPLFGDSHALVKRLPDIWSLLSALDDVTLADMPLPNAILLSTLLLVPVLRRAVELEERPGALRVHEESGVILDQISSRLRVPRRDKERARLALMGAARVLFKTDGRGMIAGLARKSYADDSLMILSLCALARGGQGKADVFRLAERLSVGPESDYLVDILRTRQ